MDKMNNDTHYPYDFDKVQIWYVAKSKSAMLRDIRFCVELPLEEAIKFLQEIADSKKKERL